MEGHEIDSSIFLQESSSTRARVGKRSEGSLAHVYPSSTFLVPRDTRIMAAVASRDPTMFIAERRSAQSFNEVNTFKLAPRGRLERCVRRLDTN
jgi:hypothetical protein